MVFQLGTLLSCHVQLCPIVAGRQVPQVDKVIEEYIAGGTTISGALCHVCGVGLYMFSISLSNVLVGGVFVVVYYMCLHKTPFCHDVDE